MIEKLHRALLALAASRIDLSKQFVLFLSIIGF